MPDDPTPRRFHLLRAVDVTGASGTGRVADGVLWPDGTVSVRWRGDRPSTVAWDRLSDAEAVHGHGGATRIVWDDPAGPDACGLPDEAHAAFRTALNDQPEETR